MVTHEKINKALSRFQFYSGFNLDFLSTEEQNYLAHNISVIHLKKKRVLFKQGNYPSGVYLLIKGKLKVYQMNYDNSVQILFIYSKGELFGYRPILSNEYQPVSVASLEDCELHFIERKHFLHILNNSVSLSNKLLISLSHEFTVLTNRMNVFAQRGIKERLALALLILNDKFREDADKNGIAEIRLSRTDLANFVGTSLENLVRTINFYKDKRLITTKGKSIFIEHFVNLFILSAIG